MLPSQPVTTVLLLVILAATPLSSSSAQVSQDVDAINTFLNGSILSSMTVDTTNYVDPLQGTRTAYAPLGQVIIETHDGHALLNPDLPGPFIPFSWYAQQIDNDIILFLEFDQITLRGQVTFFDEHFLIVKWESPPGRYYGFIDIESRFFGFKTYISLVETVDRATHENATSHLLGSWRVVTTNDESIADDQFVGYTFYGDGTFEEVASHPVLHDLLPRESSFVEDESNLELDLDRHPGEFGPVPDAAHEAEPLVPEAWFLSKQGWSIDIRTIEMHLPRHLSDFWLHGSLLILTYYNGPPVYLMITDKVDNTLELHSVYSYSRWHAGIRQLELRRE